MPRRETDLEVRMKTYERVESRRRLMPLLPAVARLDGRNFGTFTKHSCKPFSTTFEQLMTDLTHFLVRETSATIGYTQSDEITLVWSAPYFESEVFFGGRIQKMTSQLAALASVKLNRLLLDLRDEVVPLSTRSGIKVNRLLHSGLAWQLLPTFDCRVWNVPNLVEAANTLIWRQSDASRNSVQMLARAHFSHSKCFEKSTSALQDMLFENFRVNWNDFPFRSKRGISVRKVITRCGFSPEEIDRLPPKHTARTNPGHTFERTTYPVEDLWFAKITNREEALFSGVTPVYLDGAAIYARAGEA